jgi:hypothetical protein
VTTRLCWRAATGHTVTATNSAWASIGRVTIKVILICDEETSAELDNRLAFDNTSVPIPISTESAFSAALDPNRTTEMTITATDRRYRAANKYAEAQRPLFGIL